MMKRLFLRLSLYLVFLLCLLTLSIPVTLGAGADNNVEWGTNDVRHDTRDLTYRNPFGAVPTNTAITIRMRVRSFDLTSMNVYVWNTSSGDIILPMTYQSNVDCPDNAPVDTNCDLWVATIPTSATATPRILYYKFQLVDGSDSDWYVDNHAHNSYDHEDRYENGTGIMVDENDSSVFNNSFNITVYDASSYSTYLDSWAQNATIYQIMPDRFRNGDNTNDQWVYPDVYGNLATLHATWHEAPEDARVTNQWSRDFFGGDLQGVMDELDYLQWLGVTAIYFNPIFNAPSNHGYDTTDYLNLNPRYGDNSLFQVFAAEAEARGIKIILDGVFNHTGSDSRYFDRYNRWNAAGQSSLGNDGSGACESASSPFATFYGFLGAPFTGPCYDGRRYESWWGYDTLPNLIDWQANNLVRDYVFDVDNDGDNGVGSSLAVIQHWYSLGADGWRFDVADEIPHDFWSQFRTQVKNNDNLNGPLYSEVWFEATPWLFGDQLDATMNYRYRKAVLGFLVNSTWTDNDNNGDQTMYYLTPSEFDYVLNSIREDYPAPAWYSMMNLMDSHDTNRALFVIREQSSNLAEAINKMRMMAALQFTYPGSPTIYYGDEIGLGARDYGGYATWGAGKSANSIMQDDPYNRHPMVWETDNYLFDSSDGTPPVGLPNVDLQNYYRTLAVIRRNYPVLRTGDVKTITIRNDFQTYGYARFDVGTGECAIVMFNRDLNVTRNISNNGDLSLPAQCTGTFYDVLPDNGVDNATGWTVSGSNITVNGVLPLTSVLLIKPMDNPNTPPIIANFPPSDLAFSGVATTIATNSSTLLSATVTAINGANIGAGEQVNFTILNGGGGLTGSSATTNGSGSASVTYNAPASPTMALIEARITAHDGKVYRSVYTVYVGLGNGATLVNGAGRFSTIGPERVGDVDTVGVQATKYGNGDVALSVATFSENPHAGPLDATLKSPVVQVNLGSTTNISAVEVVVKYTDTGNEGAYALWWWTGSGWSVINGAQSNPTDDMITFMVTATTTPSLSDLVGGAAFFVNIATQFTLDLSGTTMLQVGDEQPILIQIDNTLIDDPLNATGFTMNLPVGMRIASFANGTNGCGGTLTADPLTTFITLTGATVSANDTCIVSVNLEATDGGLKYFNAELTATLDGQPISVNANTIAVQVAFEVTMTEQELLYHLQTNGIPNGWNYILTDFVTPNMLKIAVVINGESGIVELTLAPFDSTIFNPEIGTSIMRWTVSNITNTTGGATSATYADLARQHIMTAFAHAIDDYSQAVVDTTTYDILDFVVLNDGLSIDVVGLLP